MGTEFFLRLLCKSLQNRAQKLLTAALAVALGVSLAAAALTISLGMRTQMSQSLRAYGANILLVPPLERAQKGATELLGTMPGEIVNRLHDLGSKLGLLGYAPLLYTVAEVRSQRVAVAGIWPDAMRQLSPWWQLEGKGIPDRADTGQSLVGISVARKLGLRIGDTLTVTAQGRSRTFRVAGILTSGGSEDEQIFVTLRAAQELANRHGRVSLIQVSVLTGQNRIENVIRNLEANLPEVIVQSRLQVVQAEERILSRLSFLLGLIAALLIGTSALGVAASMITSVLERTREIGLMKALGAGSGRVAALFLAEAASIGLFGGGVGYALGVGLAQVIARSVFQGGVPITGTPAVASILLGIGIATAASLAPVRRAVRIQPAIVLRGE